MWTQYDENLKENLFFQEILENHPDVIKKASEESWIICIPRIGTVETYEISVDNILDHILLKNGDNGNTQNYSTLSKKPVTVENKQIVTDNCRLFSNCTQILFKETFYNDENCRYTVWCVDKPLFLQLISCNSHRSYILENLYDCTDFLWVESIGHEVLQHIQQLCLNFLEASPNFENEYLQTQIDEIGILYSQCLQVALKNQNLSLKATRDDTFLEKLKLAVETFMQSCLRQKIICGISTYVHQSDSYLNKIIRNSSDLNFNDFNIFSKTSDIITSAKCEFGKLNNTVTILDKLNCLSRTFNKLCDTKNVYKQALTSDDLLQIFVLLMLNVNVNNWIANMIFIKDFKFSSGNYTDHNNFLITTLEAAIEYIKSNQFLDFQNKAKNIKISHNSDDIFSYIQSGNLNAMKLSLETKEENSLQSEFCHPLCICVKCEQLALINYTNYDLETRNDCDQTLLIYAALYEQTEIVEFLLSKKCDVNCVDSLGRTALHYCCLRGYQDILLLLTSAENINIDCQDSEGNTPLHLTVNNGHENCVKAFIYSNSNTNVNVVNNVGDTPLHLAAKWGYFMIVQILLENLAVSSIFNKKNQTPLDLALNYHVSNIIKQYASIEIINLPLNIEDCNKGCSTNENVTVQCQNHGVRPKCLEQIKKMNLLLNAIKNNDLPLFTYYLGFSNNFEEDTNISVKCHPLCNCDKCQSMDGSDSDECDQNIQVCININTCNSEGYTLLHVAAQYGHKKIIRILLDSQALPNLKTYKSLYTPLHLACLHQRIQVVKELVNCSNCDVNSRDFKGNTPLFYACLKNDGHIIELLLNSDADSNIKNCKGKTVWDLCQDKMLYRVFKMLKDKFKSVPASNDFFS